MSTKLDNSVLNTFWRTLTKVDKSKVNTSIAFRNAVAVALPLCVGIALHNSLGAVAITSGALNVSYSDGTDPYKQRARRMLLWTLLGGLAVFLGSVTGSRSWLAVPIAAAWAFVAGLCVAVSPRAGDLGLNTLVSLIVFAARGALGLVGAAEAGALVVAGGLLQMLFALVFWPIHRTNPERRVLGKVYLDLSKELSVPGLDASITGTGQYDILEAHLKNPNQQVQETLDALGRDHTVEGERFRMLFDQANRLRVSTFVLHRLSTRPRVDERHPEVCAESEVRIRRLADSALSVSATLIESVSHCITSGISSADHSNILKELKTVLERAHAVADVPSTGAYVREIVSAMDVLAGQLRVVVALADHTSSTADQQLAIEQSNFPWRLRLTNWWTTLIGNIDARSPYFRHAVRMAVCVAIGDAIGRMVSWQRSYWLPMTIAVVLRPDFATTFSRGVLRLAGTFSGLFLATVLYHLLPVSSPFEVAIGQLMLVGVFTFALRSIGAANYGVFSASVGALIVFLVAATGVPPKDVVAQRALNTFVGGVFALIAYAMWPTWERVGAGEVIAQMLDAARTYFHEIAVRFGTGTEVSASDLDEFRQAWRRARSNTEGLVDRLGAEPGTKREQITDLTSMLASSHAFVLATTGLEATLIHSPQQTPSEAFRVFAHDVEFTLYFLAAALKGSSAASETLPQLREDHTRMVKSRDRFSPEDEFVLMETDRLTVSLNTLREQVMRYVKAAG